ncbi:DUF1554 domain-containing protein [Leptospira brenneri]|uniref:DUF1554 domain-containing protein n=1 Tax=Leptospira brenneri TaxID=2023182 RepID=A0A2M9Y3H1_9LEPT|nr:DUF1554 domain-containing protein [Leptospira brenneri]PJZ46111.1 hypothetical protein CH361_09130 [Leptospira brenneri]TGK91231.1 DUF1554 domain-containing protein [Leptospira brenneri]
MRTKGLISLTFIITFSLYRCALISDFALNHSSSNLNLSTLLLGLSQYSENGIILSGSLKNANGSVGSDTEIKVTSASKEYTTTSDSKGNWEIKLSDDQTPLDLKLSASPNKDIAANFNIGISENESILQTTVSKIGGQLELTCGARRQSNNVTPHNLIIQGQEIVLTEGREGIFLKLKLDKKPNLSNTYVFAAHTWIYPRTYYGDYTRHLKPLPVVVDPPQLTFTKENYNQEQEIYIKALPDTNALNEYGFLSVISSGGLVIELYRSVTIYDTNAKHLFLTASKFYSDMGGIQGADVKCALDSNHPSKGIYKAMLVTQSTASFKRIACKTYACDSKEENENWVFQPLTTYNRSSDGVAVFDTDDRSLIKENTLRGFPDAGIISEDMEGGFWTGLGDGTVPTKDWRANEDPTGSRSTCNNWSGESYYVNGSLGQAGNLSGSFLNGGGGNCVNVEKQFSYPTQHRLLCIEQ